MRPQWLKESYVSHCATNKRLINYIAEITRIVTITQKCHATEYSIILKQ